MADELHSSDEAEALSVFAALGLAPPGSEIRAARLGGLTNRVFRIEAEGGPYCLRLPGAGTEEYIDRTREAAMARAAAEAGVSPAVLHADGATGVMVTRFVDGVTTMTPAGFADRPGAPARAAAVFRRLHDSGAAFPGRFELFAMIDDYLRILAGKTVDLPDGYFEVLKEAETVKAAFAAHPLPIVACHCDPLCENFLDTGERMWLVDWEYAGMNDPMWDSATSRSRPASRPSRTRRCWPPTSPTARPRPSVAGWSSTRPCAICSGRSGA